MCTQLDLAFIFYYELRSERGEIPLDGRNLQDKKEKRRNVWGMIIFLDKRNGEGLQGFSSRKLSYVWGTYL